ncbi:hypothetical protein [Pseudanabaena sp. FACHB-2040]|nr:hypothetical protein [Pseudanabaena sp. FACHB-2040]
MKAHSELSLLAIATAITTDCAISTARFTHLQIPNTASKEPA